MEAPKELKEGYYWALLSSDDTEDWEMIWVWSNEGILRYNVVDFDILGDWQDVVELGSKIEREVIPLDELLREHFLLFGGCFCNCNKWRWNSEVIDEATSLQISPEQQWIKHFREARKA